jgi:hypothetical protein
MMAAVVAGRARAWMLMLRFAQPWAGGLELGVAGVGVSDWIRGGEGSVLLGLVLGRPFLCLRVLRCRLREVWVLGLRVVARGWARVRPLCRCLDADVSWSWLTRRECAGKCCSDVLSFARCGGVASVGKFGAA